MDNKIISNAIEYATQEIEKYNRPSSFLFSLSLLKAEEIAVALDADVSVAKLGAVLMDIKLGEASKTRGREFHVEMGVQATEQFLAKYDLTSQKRDCVINCVAAHHKDTDFICVEAEIVCNADCYRFLHPAGILQYLRDLYERGLPLSKCIEKTKEKMEEKRNYISLDYCKKELVPYYDHAEALFSGASELLVKIDE